jgi:hypothetical protein
VAAGRRQVNDFRRRSFGEPRERLVAFVCECADERCRRAVLLTPVQYDVLRASGAAVVVDSSHAPPDLSDASR